MRYLRKPSGSTCLWFGLLLAAFAVTSCAQPQPPGDLVRFARERQSDAALQALEGGADVDQQDAAGRTALIYSGRHCFDRLALQLIRGGASVNHQAQDGRTALIEATDAGCLAVTELLLQNGALKEITDELGRNALVYATEGAASPGSNQANYRKIADLLR